MLTAFGDEEYELMHIRAGWIFGEAFITGITCSCRFVRRRIMVCMTNFVMAMLMLILTVIRLR